MRKQVIIKLSALGFYFILLIVVAIALSARLNVTRKPIESAGNVINYSQTVEQGGRITIKRQPSQSTKDCMVYTQRFLTPVGAPNLQALVDEQIDVFDEDKKEVEFTFKIPDAIAAGEYIYVSRTFYYCTWYHTIFGPKEYINRAVVIKITEKPEKKPKARPTRPSQKRLFKNFWPWGNY